MNSTGLKVITIVIKLLSIATAASAYADLIPAKWLPVAGIIFAVASTFKDAFTKLGDVLDDGQQNGSFKG